MNEQGLYNAFTPTMIMAALTWAIGIRPHFAKRSAVVLCTLVSSARSTIRTAISACQMGSEVPQPRAPRSLRPNRIGAVGAGGAESSFDARRAAPLLLAQVAAPHALQRLRHDCTGCASLSSVCQRNGCAKLVMRC